MNRRQRIVLGLGLPVVMAFAQSFPVAPPHPSWLTDYPVFRFFFKHVVKTESYADQLLAMGADDSSQRHFFKSAAGLTDAEEALLNSTASDAETAITTFDKATAAITSQLRAQNPVGPLPSSALQQLHSREAVRQQIVQNHVNALQASMTPARFQLLYSFIWNTEGPRILPAQPSANPPATVHPPAGKP